jgi:hypothetical protein
MERSVVTAGSEARAVTSARVSIAAILALLVGVASVAAIPLGTLASPVLGAVALTLAMLSRRILRRDAALRGSRLSLAGLLLGLVAVVPQAAVLVIVAVGAALHALA